MIFFTFSFYLKIDFYPYFDTLDYKCLSTPKKNFSKFNFNCQLISLITSDKDFLLNCLMFNLIYQIIGKEKKLGKFLFKISILFEKWQENSFLKR